MMGYFMQHFKKYKLKYLYLIIFIPFGLYANLSLEILNVDMVNKATIDYRVVGDFNEKLKEIIEKGIHIQIDEKIELIIKRNFWFDKKIAEKINHYSIEYHPLTKKYIYKDRHQEKTFNDLNSIIIELRKLKSVAINFNQKDLIVKKYLYFSWMVNKQKLPKSFQINIFQNQWETLLKKKINL